ncbi:cytochrome c oxidase assembly protein [Dietzia sp. E1]|nr:cytochrome c oxidase assembly protein [Dietzia sp. E1]
MLVNDSRQPHHGGHEGAAAVAGFSWGWLFVGLIVVVGLTFYAWGVVRTQHRLQRKWSTRRSLSWIVGVGLVAAAFCPPLQQFAHQHPSGHMVQHLLLGMYAPVFLVLAAPISLLLASVSPRFGQYIGRFLHNSVLRVVSHPISAALLNVGGLYVLYMTPLYYFTMQSPAAHALVQLHFLLAGYIFAWSIAGPDPAPRRPGMAMRLSVLMVAIAAHGYLAKLLYASAGDLPPGTSTPIPQLEQAAQWMYYGGEPAELLLAAALFSWHYRRRIVVAGRGLRTGPHFALRELSRPHDPTVAGHPRSLGIR